MTIITLTTVGFGEISDMSNDPAGRLLTVGLLRAGMGMVAYTVAMLAAFLMEGQLLHIFARRRMDRDIGPTSGRFIVCGETAAAWYVAGEPEQSGRSLVVPPAEHRAPPLTAPRSPSPATPPGLSGPPLRRQAARRRRGVLPCG